MPEVRNGVRGRGDADAGRGGDGRAGSFLTATVVGGGLAGCEAAWALAERGIRVTLVEMRPAVRTPAHQTDLLAELVCSNSFKSVETSNAHGLLKAELRLLGSLLLGCADEARVPGGAALAVDRVLFARRATDLVEAHPNVRVVREEATDLPAPGVVATGPLTSDRLAAAIARRLGAESLSFYDAIAPIVAADSLDRSRLFAASRYGKGGGDDYLNAPLSGSEYEAFIAELATADRYQAHDFDGVPYFEGCLPVEEMAARGRETLRYGPMKPVGLTDPATGRMPYAVVQLRRVGFQTRLRTGEQQRVFRMVPGLEAAEFLRLGSIHRNSYLNTPACLSPHLALKDAPTTLFAGQLTGIEGYTESLGTGLLSGLNLARLLRGLKPLIPPPETMLGALLAYLRDAEAKAFQPMNANFGLLPPLESAPRERARKKALLAERALAAMRAFAGNIHEA
jgi:methylenetetrahydrofolate--tRNA-(uracil-5-)-methyltransferase